MSLAYFKVRLLLSLLNYCLENRILIHLFSKQKVVDVGKQISFVNLLVREVM